MGAHIKNWAKFQHFKDRRPPWVKLYRDLLDDMEWHRLEGEAAKTLVLLWLIASEKDGELPDVETLSFRLRKSDSEVRALLSKLSHWLDQDDIAAISTRHHNDTDRDIGAIALTRSRETETETETEKRRTPVAAAPSPTPSRKKAIKTAMPDGFGVSERVKAWAQSKGYGQLDQHLEAFARKAKANGYSYADWDSAFMEAIREDWAKLRGRQTNGAAPPPETGGTTDPDSRQAIEAEGVAKGIGPWDETEQWHVYKARVRGRPQQALDLNTLAAMAAQRQGVH